MSVVCEYFLAEFFSFFGRGTASKRAVALLFWQAGEPATEIRILPASRRGPLITRSAAYPENFANRLARSEATATLWRNCPGAPRHGAL